MTLGDFSKEREKNLINAIELFKKAIISNDMLKVIISDLSKRLFYKMCEDGYLKKEDAYTDINLAVEEYNRRKISAPYPKLKFILSPILRETFGDEEIFNMAKFFKGIGEDINDVLSCRTIESDDPRKMPVLNNVALSTCFYTIELDSVYTFLTQQMIFRLLTNDLSIELIDIIRYILGIYDIKDNQVIITTPQIFPHINNLDLAFGIFNNHFKIMQQEGRYIALDAGYIDNQNGFLKYKTDFEYLVHSFNNTVININKLSKTDEEDIEVFLKWGLLTKDVNGNYHVNFETYSLLPYVLNGYYHRFLYSLFNFYKYYKRDNDVRTIYIKDYISKIQNSVNNNEELERVSFFANKFNDILSNNFDCFNKYSLNFFNKYYDELVLFKDLLEEKKEKKLIRK